MASSVSARLPGMRSNRRTGWPLKYFTTRRSLVSCSKKIGSRSDREPEAVATGKAVEELGLDRVHPDQEERCALVDDRAIKGRLKPDTPLPTRHARPNRDRVKPWTRSACPPSPESITEASQVRNARPPGARQMVFRAESRSIQVGVGIYRPPDDMMRQNEGLIALAMPKEDQFKPVILAVNSSGDDQHFRRDPVGQPERFPLGSQVRFRPDRLAPLATVPPRPDSQRSEA